MLFAGAGGVLVVGVNAGVSATADDGADTSVAGHPLCLLMLRHRTLCLLLYIGFVD